MVGNVVAAVNGLEGFVMVTDKGSACFGCLYPDEVKLSVSLPRASGAAENVGVLAACDATDFIMLERSVSCIVLIL